MKEAINTIVISLFTSLVAGFTGWFFTKKKYNKEVERAEIENIDISSETWQKMVDRLESRIMSMSNSLELMRTENLQLKEKLYDLQTQVEELKDQNKKLICKINDLKRYEKKHTDNTDTVID